MLTDRCREDKQSKRTLVLCRLLGRHSEIPADYPRYPSFITTIRDPPLPDAICHAGTTCTDQTASDPLV